MGHFETLNVAHTTSKRQSHENVTMILFWRAIIQEANRLVMLERTKKRIDLHSKEYILKREGNSTGGGP